MYGPLGSGALGSPFGTDALIAHWRQRRDDATRVAMEAAGSTATPLVLDAATGNLTLQGPAPSTVISTPEIVVGALVEKGGRIHDGDLIVGVTPIFRRFIRELAQDPNALYRLDPRQMEELVAGAYEEEGATVILTPRSGDLGRDVIATIPHYGTIRIIDQVKLLGHHRIVDATVVRELNGVLNNNERGASKGIVTTTTSFAPGIAKEFADLIPGCITLRDGDALKQWILARCCAESWWCDRSRGMANAVIDLRVKAASCRC